MLSAACLLVAIVPAGVQLEGAARLRTETSAGVVPVSEEESLTALDVSFHPGITGALVFNRGRLAADYEVDLVRRFPHRSAPSRPIVFQSLRLDYTEVISRQWSIAAGVGAGLGELDYDDATLLFRSGTLGADGTVSGSTPLSPVIEALRSDAGLRFAYRPTRKASFDLALTAALSEPRGEVESFSATQSLALEFGWRHQVTRADRLGLSLMARVDRSKSPVPTVVGGAGAEADASSAATLRFESITTALAWDRRVGRMATLEASGGLGLVTERLAAPSLGPFMDVGTVLHLVRRRRHGLDWRASVGVDAFFDPVLGTIERRFTARAGVEYRLGALVTAGLSGAFATPLEGVDRGDDRTYLAGELPISIRLTDAVVLDGGARVSARAPHLGSSNFRFRQLLAEAYAAVTATLPF
ncbi:MAG: hypothetical protein IPK13_14795 [Deltaproteobacteria bacterium]|nr:hypothetical protein [Deltaproteobacteria bacterium]